MTEGNDNLIIAVGVYNGHSARGNFDVEFRIRFTESNTPQALQFVAGIGQHLKMIATIAGQKIKLGTWSVYRVTIDRNMQTTVVFKTNMDAAFVNNLPLLMVEDEEITLAAKAVSQ